MELQLSYETLSIYQTARCHNQESANPHRHCRNNFITSQNGHKLTMPVAVRYKAQVCGRSITGNAVSNTADGMDIVSCVCCVLCR